MSPLEWEQHAALLQRAERAEAEVQELRQRIDRALHWSQCAAANCANVRILGEAARELTALQIRIAISWLEGNGEEAEE